MALDRSSILLGVQDETIQVTVLDDGQPVEEDTITLTLVKTGGGTISDIIVTEATLLIHAGINRQCTCAVVIYMCECVAKLTFQFITDETI